MGTYLVDLSMLRPSLLGHHHGYSVRVQQEVFPQGRNTPQHELYQ